MIRKPMKPATLSDGPLEDVENIPFPVYATPKFDGIRCCIQDGKALTYNLKRIPNDHVRNILERVCPDGMDGELIVTHTVQDYFNNTQSGIMSHDGRPDFKYCVFDSMPGKKDIGYLKRCQYNENVFPKFVEFITPVKINNMKELLGFERSILKQNFEGIILRTDAPYKFGRSTLKQFWMVKYKRFSDGEAEVIGIIELMSNQNEAKRNVVGTIQRSKNKAGLVPMNMAGSLEVRDLKTGVECSVGGMTLKQRKEIWRNRKNKKKSILGAIISYKFQKHGMKDKPRFCVLKGRRLD